MTESLSPTRPAARIDLAAAPASARLARRFVDRTLAEWGLGHATDAATLLVSELVTNAVLHVRSPIRVVVRADSGILRVEVHDGSAIAPMLRVAEHGMTTGRGLALVDAFSARWGVDELPDGKAVWFELAE